MERDAAVARIAEQPRPRRHQTTAPRGSVGEGPGDDHSDGDLRMPLIEGTVPGAGGADHVLHRPSFAPGQQVGGGPSRRSGGGPPGERPPPIGPHFFPTTGPAPPHPGRPQFPPSRRPRPSPPMPHHRHPRAGFATRPNPTKEQIMSSTA